MPLADHVDYDVSEHESRLLCGDPKACAWAWIEAYAENINDRSGGFADNEHIVTADELIEVGLSHVNPNHRWGGDYISNGGQFEGMGTDPIFWDKLAALKGIEIPTESRNGFFSCSC